MKKINKTSTKNNKIKLFIDKHNWKGINFPSERDDWKKCEKNNITIALNVLSAKKMFCFVLHMFRNTTQPVKNKSFF